MRRKIITVLGAVFMIACLALNAGCGTKSNLETVTESNIPAESGAPNESEALRESESLLESENPIEPETHLDQNAPDQEDEYKRDEAPFTPESQAVSQAPVASDIPQAEAPQAEIEKPTTATPSNEGTANGSYAQQVLDLVNEQRAANGLSALTLSSSLNNVAQVKAQDMKDNQYFDHTSPTYGSPFDMMKSFGISYSAAGENIAMGQTSPSAVVTGWMNSTGHRANILSSNFTQMGLGYVQSGHYWCQMFIR